MWRLRIMLSVVIALIITTGAYAQGGGNVAIGGTVSDPSGAVIAGAKVTVTQKATASVREDITNASGQFNIPSLPPATYTVSVVAAGFKYNNQDVVLLADQSATWISICNWARQLIRSRLRHRVSKSIPSVRC